MATRSKWLYVALGATGALALVLGSAFAAQTTARAASDPAAGAGARLAPAAPGRNGIPGTGELPLGDYNKALAAALGVSEDDLDAAYQQAWEAALADAIEQGTLTQAQADEMRDAGRPGRRGAARPACSAPRPTSTPSWRRRWASPSTRGAKHSPRR